jgi:1,4-alpha-glucan branching enzyme
MISKKFFKTKDECEITFELEVDGETAALLTDMNNWEPVAMTKRRKDGVFYAKVRFPINGRYQFRYMVDGSVWLNDDTADDHTSNEHGSQNSVVDTTA